MVLAESPVQETLESAKIDILRELRHWTCRLEWVSDVWGEPYEWQRSILGTKYRRRLIVAARQSGKSRVVSAIPSHKGKYQKDSLNLIFSPTERQSKETMIKVYEFMREDPTYPDRIKNSTFEKYLNNESRIIALPGSPESSRSYSGPDTLIIDEAAFTMDALFKSVTPMLTGTDDSELIVLSTPHGRQGWFFEAWENGKTWHKTLVKPKYTLKGGRLVEDVPEKKFQAYWKEQGVDAYYSPRHTKEFLQEELDSIGEWWFRQEYLCEFLESDLSFFSYDDILAAAADMDPWEEEGGIGQFGEDMKEW